MHFIMHIMHTTHIMHIMDITHITHITHIMHIMCKWFSIIIRCMLIIHTINLMFTRVQYSTKQKCLSHKKLN